MMSDAVVYVVDDDASVRRSLARLLESVGLNVRVFASPEEFLESASYDDLSCLVLDVRLPGTSGLTLQEELAATGRRMPVIFITGHGDIPMTVRAMKAGAVDFLPKPFSDRDLLDAVHSALEQERHAREVRAELSELQDRVESLTPREREVFAFVIKGLLNKQIAARMGISEKTVKVHRGRVMRKMRADSLAQLVRMAERAEITPG